MTEHHSRRGFLTGLFREAARGAKEVSGVLGPPGLKPLLDGLGGGDASGVDVVEGGEAPALAEPRLLAPMRPATHRATELELLELIEETGLGDHREALRALARPTVRLTPGDPEDEPAGWLGGEVWLPVGVDWPEWGGLGLSLLARFDLGHPALADLGLPAAGQLLLFFDASRRPDGQAAAQRGAARALLLPAPVPGSDGLPVRASVELALPRVWSAPVQALELEPAEHGAYVRLRAELAKRQGVAAPDDAEPGRADHRLLGYPTETTGAMPAVCELTARGEDADGPADPELARIAGERWRLLAQVTVDDALELDPPAAGVERVFFWIPAEDLAVGDLSRVWAIPHTL